MIDAIRTRLPRTAREHRGPVKRIALLTASCAALPMMALAAVPASAATAAQNSFVHYNHGGGAHASSNWGGYAVTGGKYTSATASWVVPALDCSKTNGDVSPWAGIDGWKSTTVEQIGLDMDCVAGKVKYHPWVEMFPANSVYFTDTVRKGDSMTASVSVTGTAFTLTESDSTQGWTKTYNKTGKDQLSSAEAIMEAIGSSSSIPPAVDWGTINFTNVTANGQQYSAVGTANKTVLQRSNTPLETVSALNGEAFSQTWIHS